MKAILKITKTFVLTHLAVFAVIIAAIMVAGCQTTPPPKPYMAPQDVTQQSGWPYVFISASEMAEAIKNRDISSQELVELHLAHIYLHNPELNAIVTLDADKALKRAAEADEALEKGEIWGPLHGVPVTIKDHFAVRNMLTTNAYPDTAEQVTLFDATIVERMKDAGAVILGKTNMPVLAMDFQTDNPLFGKTVNPWDTDRTPGGSGGGGGAAVAAGLSPIDIGSDIGGSLRIPAHFTGTYSFKPTENTVSNHGSFPGLIDPEKRRIRHMSSIGPIARSIGDLRLAFEIISGPDGKDPLVTPVKNDKNDEQSIDSLRIAWSNKFGDVSVGEETRDVMREFINSLTDAGATVVRANPDINFDSAWTTWGEMFDMQIMAGQPGYLRLYSFVTGWSYRYQTPLHQMVYPYSTEKHVQILTKRDHIVAAFDRFMSDWDVFICPVATRHAMEHHPPDAVRMNMPIYIRPVMVDDHELNYHTAMAAYAVPFNLTGHPVVTIPAGLTPEGMPVGLQIVGKRWDDYELLQIAKMIDEIIDAHRIPEGY